MGILKFLAKTALVLGVLFGLSLIVLGNIGGNNDNLKNMVTSVFASATGKIVRIETLNDFQFFPNLILDVSGVSLYDLDDDQMVNGGADRIFFKMGFMDMFFSTGKIKAIEAKNVYANAGLYTPEKIQITAASIQDDKAIPEQAKFSLVGLYGTDPLSAEITMDARGIAKKRIYSFSKDNHHLQAVFADLLATLDVDIKSKNKVFFNNISIKKSNADILKGSIAMHVKGSARNITGDVAIGERTQLIPNIAIGFDGSVSGALDFPKAEPTELAAIAATLTQMQKRFVLPKANKTVKAQDANDANAADVKSQTASAPVTEEIDPLGLKALNIDLNINMPKITMNGLQIASQNFVIKAKNGKISAAAPKGTIAEGKSSFYFNVAPQAEGKLSNVDVKFKLDDLKTLPLLLAANGGKDLNLTVDGSLSVKAAISSWNQLKQKAKASITLTTEDGTFETRWLNMWGNGLASLILPSLSGADNAKLNCGIVHAVTNKGNMELKAFYADGKHVRVTGAGGYDIINDKMKFRIKPHTKGISIGDLSTAINITGPLAKPKIRPDMVETGKKAVGLLLGAVNPALLAVTGTDTALSSSVTDFCPAIDAIEQSNKAAAYAETAK